MESHENLAKIIKIQALIRGWIVRNRMKKARQTFENICLEINSRIFIKLRNKYEEYKINWDYKSPCYPTVLIPEETYEEKMRKKRMELEQKLLQNMIALQSRYAALKMRDLHNENNSP